MAARNILRNQEQRRSEIQRVDSVTGDHTRVSGALFVQGSGQATATLTFPVNFIEKPLFSFGGEIHQDSAPGDTASVSSFPVLNASVFNWIVDEPTDNSVNKVYYRGCSLAIVVYGLSTTNMWLHYHFDGKAITNPATRPVDALTTGSTL